MLKKTNQGISHKKRAGRALELILLLAFLVAVFVLVSIVGPTQIVNIIGIHNSYILAFLVSFFGGFSAGGSATFISLLITLVAGGIDPIALGIVSGVSLALGDMIMFYIGRRGRDFIEGSLDRKIDRFTEIFEKNNLLKKITPVIAFIYIGILPLPNDIMILFLAALKYPVAKMNKIIILADLTFALILTNLVARGIIPLLF